MSNRLLYSKIQMLQSDELKQDLMQYVEFLLAKQSDKKPSKRIPVFGSAKGTFQMSADFDEPLEDFNEYMPQ
jgi:hypothetical protein